MRPRYWGGYLTDAQVFASSVQQAGTCTGKVFDTDGEPVIGASVSVVGTSKGTATNIDGEFTLSGVKPGDKIRISGVGFAPQEIVDQLQNPVELLKTTRV